MIFSKKKRRRKTKQKTAKIFKPQTSRYIVLTFKTFISFLIFIFLIGALIFFLKSDYFKIAYFDCEKEQLPCSIKEKDFFLDVVGENIILLNANKISKIIKKNHPLIKEIAIEKKFPNRLLVKIKDREEFASINQDKEVWFIIDNSGFILKKTYEKPKNLPEIFTPFNELSLNIGQKLDQQEIISTLLILQQLKDSFIFLERLVLREEVITLFLSNDLVASLSASKKTLTQVGSLQFILRQSKIDGRIPLSIDLRFDKPVIRY